MTFRIVKLDAGYRVQRIHDNTYVNSYDIQFEAAKNLMLSAMTTEAKKIKKLYKK